MWLPWFTVVMRGSLKPIGQLPSSSYNPNTLTTLRIPVREWKFLTATLKCTWNDVVRDVSVLWL